MKITIDLSDRMAEKFKQYMAMEAKRRSRMAEIFEQNGDVVSAQIFREPLTEEEAARMIVIEELKRVIP
jgi:hypothetical protein